MTSGAEAPIYARVNSRGQVQSADPPLLRLHLSAGGHMGGEFALPQLAALVRLVRQKGEAVTRQIIIGDGADVRLVAASLTPDPQGISIVLDDWETRLPPSDILTVGDADFDFARLEADGAWRTDAQLRIVRMAAGLDKDLGFLPSTARGYSFARIFRLVPDATGDMPLLAALANHTPFDNQLAELSVSNNAPVLLSGAPVFDAEGSFAGLAGRVQLIHRAPVPPDPAQSPSVLDMLLATRLEPALRAPIGRVIDHADAMALREEGPLREDYVRYAEDIAGAARHMLRLVDDLANINAIEQPDFTIETEPVDLVDSARRAAGLLAVRAMDRGVTIHVPNGTVLVAGDFGRVLQILVNLLANAIRYAPENSVVRLEPLVEADWMGMAVVDEGKGIAPDQHDRVFQKFERLEGDSAGGSGLGLYISRTLARAMGGDILLDSDIGQGARFTLRLRAAVPLGSS